MLKVTEDGKNLYCYKEDGYTAFVARWAGNDIVLGVKAVRLEEDEIPQLAAFIAAGPPKPKWRITKEFNFKPTTVQGEWLVKLSSQGMHEADFYALGDSDVEEV